MERSRVNFTAWGKWAHGKDLPAYAMRRAGETVGEAVARTIAAHTGLQVVTLQWDGNTIERRRVVAHNYHATLGSRCPYGGWFPAGEVWFATEAVYCGGPLRPGLDPRLEDAMNRTKALAHRREHGGWVIETSPGVYEAPDCLDLEGAGEILLAHGLVETREDARRVLEHRVFQRERGAPVVTAELVARLLD